MVNACVVKKKKDVGSISISAKKRNRKGDFGYCEQNALMNLLHENTVNGTIGECQVWIKPKPDNVHGGKVNNILKVNNAYLLLQCKFLF